MTDSWNVAGRTFTSRLIVGTGKYKDFEQNAAAVEMWGRAQQDGKTTGNYSQASTDGSQVSMQWDASHASSTTVFEGKLPGGLIGKVTTKVDVTTCPDASGKVDVGFTSEAEIRASGQAGTGALLQRFRA